VRNQPGSYEVAAMSNGTLRAITWMGSRSGASAGLFIYTRSTQYRTQREEV